MGLARVYSSQGDFDNAVKEVKLSLSRERRIRTNRIWRIM